MDNRTVVVDYFAAINEERWEDFAALLTDDVTYRTVGGRPQAGRDRVVSYFQSLFRAWSEHNDDPVAILVDGDRAAAEVRFRGVSAAGKPIEFDAVDIFLLEDGRLAGWSTWYDLPAVRSALSDSHDG